MISSPWLIYRQRRSVRRAILAHKGCHFRIRGRIPDSMSDHIDSGFRRDFYAFERHGVGEHGDARLVRLFDNCNQSFRLHTAQIGTRAVTPTVCKYLDRIRLVRHQLPGLGRGFARGRHLNRKEIAPSGFRAVTARRCHTRGKLYAWPGHRTGAEQSPHGFKHLSIGPKIDHGGDSAIEVCL